MFRKPFLSPRLQRVSLCWLLATITHTIVGEARAASVEQVIVVFKTHFDIGYTDMASNVVQRYRTSMIEDALKVVDQNRGLPAEQQFVWTLPGWPFSKIIESWPGQDSKRQQRIRNAFKDGRFAIHALPFTTHTELLEPEDLVRALEYASQVSKENGVPLPRDAKMTDVPSHSWILPTVLREAGVDFLHLGCNAASSSPQVPLLFWWEGPDGSRLLTMYTAESYGTGLLPPANWPHKTWLALIHTGDNHGPPTPEEVSALLQQAEKQLPGVKVRLGRLSDFADAILKEDSQIPVIRGDMPDTWIHGPMCDPQGAKLARNLRPAMLGTEAVGTLLRLWNVPAVSGQDTLARAFEQSLLYGEHTWGGALYWVTGYGADTKWGYGEAWKAERTAGRFSRLEASWAEHTAYIETANALLQPLLQQRLSALARGISVSGQRVVVFNPLPWSRSDVVSVRGLPDTVRTLRSTGMRENLPTAASGTECLFFASDLPAGGYATFRPVETGELQHPHSERDKYTIENAFFKVAINPSEGCIRSIFDKRSGRELVDQKSPHGFGQFLYERFNSNQVASFVKAYVKIDADWALNELGKPKLPPASKVPYRASHPRNCRVEFQENALFSTLALNSEPIPELPFPITTRIFLYHQQPHLDIEVTLEEKPADPWPEAGWLCLPFNVKNPRFRVGRQSSVIDPVADIVPGANRHLLAVNTGVAFLEPDGWGVAFCPIDSPLVSLAEPGCWKYSMDFVPTRPSAYVNLFNNQWTTNFRLWNEGTITSRVRIWSFDEYSPERSLIKPSLEARFPLQAAFTDGPAGKLPPESAGLEIDRDGVLITAFGPNPNGPGTLLRLWELAGQSGPCRIRLPEALATCTAQPMNLRGEVTAQLIKAQSGGLNIQLRGFAPASFVLQQ